jgi:PAS domain S-box-containing protein
MINNKHRRLVYGGLSLLFCIVLIGGIFVFKNSQLSNIPDWLTPRDPIFQQDPILLWTKIFSNGSLALACFVLFFILRYAIKKRRDFSNQAIFWLFAMVFISFGILNLEKIWGLFQPLYWSKALIEAFTAILVSISTLLLLPLLPQVLRLRGNDEFEMVNKKLHESEKQFAVLVAGIKDYAIFKLDPVGNILTWNEGAQRTKGYLSKDIIGKNFSCFFRPEDIQAGKPLKILEMATKNGRYHEESLRVRKDGSLFWADVTITALYDTVGVLTGFGKVTRDITERIEAMRVLEEQAALFDIFNDAIIVRNMDGSVRYWNKGAERIYGYTEEEALNHKAHELLKTEFPQSQKETDTQVISERHWEDELVQYTKDNRRIITESRQALKTGNNGEPASIVEINTDITARKEAEEKQMALAEMERVNAELEQFASIASHDLQEPLRAIAGCLQILEKTYKGRLDDKADELIKFSVDGAVRMRALITDLLALTRVDREQMTVTENKMTEILEQVKINLASAIEESGAIISYENLPTIFGNNTLLTLLLQNLISNAIKFRGDKIPEIVIKGSPKDEEWLFSVQDNSIGFDQKYANQIFQPFKRLHRKEEYPGTGIGLPICKRIVERHGGNIWAESQAGKGTKFYFTLAKLIRNKANKIAA